MSLEDLEQDLYERDPEDIERRQKERRKKKEVQEKKRRAVNGEWETDRSSGGLKDEENVGSETMISRKAFWKKAVFWGVGLTVGLSILLSIFYIVSSLLSKGVEIRLKLPEETVKVGVPFEAVVEIENLSDKELDKGRVSLTLPESFVFTGSQANQRVLAKDIGMVRSGEIKEETFSVLPIANPQTVQEIMAGLIYETEALGSEFEVRTSERVTLEEPVVKLDLVTPRKVFNGEKFETIITYGNNSEEETKPFKIKIEYPKDFEFLGSSQEASDEKDSLFEQEGLSVGEERELSISGSLFGKSESFYSFKAQVISEVEGKEYSILERSASLAIQTSPLSLSIDTGTVKESVYPGEEINYTLFYENNTETGLRDVIIEAQLGGEMYNFSEVEEGKGSYDSRRRTVVWNASRVSDLRLISPGDSGTVNFSVPIREDYPIARINDKNYTVAVMATIESETVPEGVAAEATIGVAESELKVAGKTEIDTQVKFRDAGSGFINAGVWPPQAEAATQYTVHWIITNYATDVSGVTVKAFLGAGVYFTGNVKSNTVGVPRYNERTQEMIWEIGQIAATKGVVGSPVEAVFQIESVPSASSRGSYAPLIGKTELLAQDEFTGREINSSDGEVTTKLPDDGSINSDEGKVR